MCSKDITTYWTHMSNKDRLSKYSPDEMVYAILNKLNIRWYLGLESALERNKLIWQGVVNPVILNSELSGE